MLIIVLVTLLVLGVAFFQITQGLFSALIMAFLTIICAMVAINFYEPLGYWVASSFNFERDSNYMLPAAMMALFVIPLLALRIGVDHLIGSNVAFGPWADRIGGGAMGLIVGMVCAGVLMIAVQMLPVGETVFGYEPFGQDMKRQQRLAPFYPDEFVVGLSSAFSKGVLSGDVRWSTTHEDLLRELAACRNTAGKNGRVDAKPDSMNLMGVYNAPDASKVRQGDLDQWTKNVKPNPLLGDEPYHVYVVRVSVSTTLADSDRWLRLPGTQFCLTTATTSRGYSGHEYYPVGYLTFAPPTAPKTATGPASAPAVTPDAWKIISDLDKDTQAPALRQIIVERDIRDQKEMTVDWVYCLREGEVPAFVTFRRICQRPVNVEKVSDWNEKDMRKAALDRKQ